MKRIQCLTKVLLGVALFSAAWQVEAVVSVPSGWYVEGNGGWNRLNDSNYGTNTSTSMSGMGWNLNGGFKFMPYFAAELGITKYGNASVKSNSVSVAKVTYWSYDLAGKAILPVSDSGVDLFAKLGIARLNTHATSSNASYISQNNLSINLGSRDVTGAYIGVGGGYSFMPNLAMVAQWQRTKGNNITGNADLYSLGLNYVFG